MLVFSRRVGEEIIIHGEIRVQVLAVNRQRTRIGVAAPYVVRVDRGEIHRRRLQNEGDEQDEPTQEGCASDCDLHRRVTNFLYGLNIPTLRRLQVDVHKGGVVIKGLVRTYYHKQLATHCCQRVAGVLSVTNEVRVDDTVAGISSRS